MSKLFIILPVISSLFPFNGCRDSEINPFEEETGTYSVYGSIDMHETDHVIRVRDLNTFFNSESSQNLDATVTFYDLEEGTSQVLQDSVVRFPANYTHNFLLNKAFKPSRRYKVAVERSNGESVSSMFTTPAITESEFFSVSRKVGCYTPFQLIFKNVMSDEQIRIEFGVKYDNKTYWFEFTNVCITEYFEDRHELVITANPTCYWTLFGLNPEWIPRPTAVISVTLQFSATILIQKYLGYDIITWGPNGKRFILYGQQFPMM